MRSSDAGHILVLAAGRGTRMGGPKMLMDVGGRAWWNVQREKLAHVGLPVTWAISREAAAALLADRDASELLSDAVACDSRAPMFQSLVEGLVRIRSSGRATSPGGVFVLPVDVPAARPEVWNTLFEAAAPAVPAHGGVHGHPVFLPWSWLDVHIPADLSSTDSEQLRLDRLIEPVRVIVEVDDPDVAVNLNSREDVDRWLASHPHHHRPGASG